jgi:hypothetical protein
MVVVEAQSGDGEHDADLEDLKLRSSVKWSLRRLFSATGKVSLSGPSVREPAKCDEV